MQTFRALAKSAAALATGRMGWTPDAFWAATPADLRIALEGRVGPSSDPPLGRGDLERLKERLG